jgi:uroporphyrinogen decarboxylase
MAVFARGSHYALESLSHSGYDIVSLDWTIAPEIGKRETGGRVTLQGNADPSLLYADPAKIEEDAKKMLSRFGTNKRFVFSFEISNRQFYLGIFIRYIANLGHGMYPGIFKA